MRARSAALDHQAEREKNWLKQVRKRVLLFHRDSLDRVMFESDRTSAKCVSASPA